MQLVSWGRTHSTSTKVAVCMRAIFEVLAARTHLLCPEQVRCSTMGLVSTGCNAIPTEQAGHLKDHRGLAVDAAYLPKVEKHMIHDDPVPYKHR